MECAEVLWTQRAQHKTGGLSTSRAEKSRNPHIKTSRDLIEKPSRDSHKLSKFSSREHLIKSSRDAHHHSYLYIILEHGNLVETPASYIIQSRCVHMLIYLTHALDSCILDVYTSRYTHTSCISVHTRSRLIQNVGMTLRSKKLIGQKASTSFPMNSSILAYRS